MDEDDNRHWKKLQEQHAAHRPRPGEGEPDPALLHPGNEGHDAERERERLEHWAREGGDRGRSARALGRLDAREKAAAAPEGEATPKPAAAVAEPPHYGGNTRGGEPKKHPRPRAETTPEPGRGGTYTPAQPGEPPAMELGPDGKPRYHPGETYGKKSAAEVTKAKRGRPPGDTD